MCPIDVDGSRVNGHGAESSVWRFGHGDDHRAALPVSPESGLARVALLGPADVTAADGRPIRMGSGRQMALLALLSLRANAPVTAGALLEGVWDLPYREHAVQQLHTYMCRLRRVIQPDCPRWHRQGVLASANGSYMLTLAPEALDVVVFEHRISQAAAARKRGDVTGARDQLRAALATWRGEPFAGLPGPALDRERLRLTECWLSIKQELLALDVLSGGHTAAIPELRALVSEHPAQERLVGLLMLALYRSGRQSDALGVYADTRRRLAEELGIEPGGELQRLHVRILRAEPDLLACSEAGVEAYPPPVKGTIRFPEPARPVQLPHDIAGFAGRAAESTRLADLLAAPAAGTWMPLAAVAGRPGVGKSALALHVAHRIRASFPDGAVYLDLRGTQPPATDPTDALELVLKAVGVPPTMLPDSLDERTALLRSVVADRKILFVLDNARAEEQVRPLLPGSPGCAVLVTSRQPLAGLDGAMHVHLDSLDDPDGLVMLRRMIGNDRADSDAGAARRIVAACEGLPLAIHIAAARLIEQPGWPLRHLADLLTDEGRRLDVLATRDRALRRSIAAAVDLLTPTQLKAFIQLSRIAAAPFDAHAAARVLRTQPAVATRLLDDLVRCQLLDVTGWDPLTGVRVRYHGLIQIYARERAISRIAGPSTDATG
jgi:DNA-binding SARP family transcriptional activator